MSVVCLIHQVIVNSLLRNTEICGYINKRQIKQTTKQCARGCEYVSLLQQSSNLNIYALYFIKRLYRRDDNIYTAHLEMDKCRHKKLVQQHQIYQSPNKQNSYIKYIFISIFTYIYIPTHSNIHSN